MLTLSQIQWACSHDWFIRANADGSIVCRDVSTKDGKTAVTEKTFTSWPELYAWAGY